MAPKQLSAFLWETYQSWVWVQKDGSVYIKKKTQNEPPADEMEPETWKRQLMCAVKKIHVTYRYWEQSNDSSCVLCEWSHHSCHGWARTKIVLIIHQVKESLRNISLTWNCHNLEPHPEDESESLRTRFAFIFEWLSTAVWLLPKCDDALLVSIAGGWTPSRAAVTDIAEWLQVFSVQGQPSKRFFFFRLCCCFSNFFVSQGSFGLLCCIAFYLI